MKRIVSISTGLLAYLITSIALLFYSYDSRNGADDLMRFLYFSKAPLLIILLLAHYYKHARNILKPLVISTIVFLGVNTFYEYLLLNMPESSIEEMLKNTTVCYLIALSPLAAYSLSKVYLKNDREQEENREGVITRVSRKVREWVYKKAKGFNK